MTFDTSFTNANDGAIRCAETPPILIGMQHAPLTDLYFSYMVYNTELREEDAWLSNHTNGCRATKEGGWMKYGTKV
jgi:hypothetical protein